MNPAATAAPGAGSRRRPAWDLLALGLGYFLLALVSMVLARERGNIAAVWFANAAAVAFIVRREASRWPALIGVTVLADLAANLAISLVNGDRWLSSLAFLPGNAVDIGLGCWLLARTRWHLGFAESPRAFGRMLLAGAVAPALLGATCGAAVVAWQGLGAYRTFWVVWIDWCAGSLVGAITLLPLALMLSSEDERRRPTRGTVAWLALLTSGLAALTWLGMALLPYVLVYIGLLLIVVALRVGPLATFALCLAEGATIVVAFAFGVLPSRQLAEPLRHLAIFVPIIAMVLPAQLLAISIRQLDVERNRLAALTSAATDIVAFVGLRGRLLAVNRACARLAQLPPHQVVGRTVDEAFAQAGVRAIFEAGLARAIAGELWTERTVIDVPGLGPRTMDVTLQPARDTRDTVSGAIFSAHDVHDLVLSEQSLRSTVAHLSRANDNLQQFARISAHDLREPLNAIIGFTSLIEDGGSARELNPPTRSYLALVSKSAARMKAVLDDLLQFVRLDAIDPNALRPVDLAEVLKSVQLALHHTLGTTGAVLEIEPLPFVRGLDNLLGLLFQNLIGNALKFVPRGEVPRVRVYCEHLGATVKVTVEDNGIGIAPEHLDRLFEPFVRLHTRREFEGTGLGLAIARRIAEAHGGRVWCESEPGVGSRFHVELPEPPGQPNDFT